MRREPEVPEERVPVVECLDGPARITLKELAQLHSGKSGTLQNACSTSRRMDADLGKSALMRIARLKNSLAKGLKRMVTKVQWLCWRRMSVTKEQGDLFGMLTHQIHDKWVAYFRIWSRRGLHRFYGRAQTLLKPIRCVKFTKAVLRHANIRDQNPSLGYFGEPHERNSKAPKFADRSQEETEWQEQGAREAAWKFAKNILISRRKIKQHSSHFRKIGVCLHQILKLRNEKLLSTPERRCTWSAKRTWILLKWIPWRSRVVLRLS